MDTDHVRPTSPTLAGSKRKRASDVKYYAVREGKDPGVYTSWPECLDQVKGHKNASFKSFSTSEEAEHFVRYGSNLRQSGKGPQKYYAIQSGRVPGVYTEWDVAKSQIVGWTKPKYKSFPSREEAEAFVRERGNPESTPDITSTNGSPAPNGGKAPPLKKQKKRPADGESLDMEEGDFEPGEGPLPNDFEDGFDPRVTLNPETGKVEYKTDDHLNKQKWQVKGPVDDGMLRIYTDGSALGNGANGAVAGVGVYFGPNDKRNVSEALRGQRQTNQRAELTAVQRALELSPRDRPITIYSDSHYAINCVTIWFQKWRSNGWKSASGKPVENRDLVEKILTLIEEREQIARRSGRQGEINGSVQNARVQFVWVKGHQDDPGNVAADGLATAGAREAKELAAME